MTDKMAETIIKMMEAGGTEAASLLRLHIWLNSSLVKGMFLWGAVIMFFLGCIYLVDKVYDRAKTYD